VELNEEGHWRPVSLGYRAASTGERGGEESIIIGHKNGHSELISADLQELGREKKYPNDLRHVNQPIQGRAGQGEDR